MSDKIRWGILSTANIGRTRVIPAIQKSRNGEVAAVASRSADRARKFADALNIPTSYGDYESLLADPNVDAIYIPLPNSHHAEWSIKCAEAGKPTLCEKPLASDADEAQRMVDAFKSRDVLFAEAFMYRFHPQTDRVKAIIASGGVGELQCINASFSFFVRSAENIRLSKDLAGGSLMDVGCYCVNIMRHLTEEMPARVQALAQVGPDTGVDERLVGLLQFPSGVLGHFDCSLQTMRVHSYEVRGTEGRILLEESFVPDPGSPVLIRHWHNNDYQEITIDAVDQYQLMVEDFADSLLLGRAPRFDPQDGVENMQVIDRLLASL